AGLFADVEAETCAFAFVGGQKPAEHADGRGFPGAVRPEKAVDRAARHGDVEMIDHALVAKALGEPAYVYDRFAGHGATVTGWPGCSTASEASVASTRKVSRSR